MTHVSHMKEKHGGMIYGTTRKRNTIAGLSMEQAQ